MEKADAVYIVNTLETAYEESTELHEGRVYPHQIAAIAFGLMANDNANDDIKGDSNGEYYFSMASALRKVFNKFLMNKCCISKGQPLKYDLFKELEGVGT